MESLDPYARRFGLDRLLSRDLFDLLTPLRREGGELVVRSGDASAADYLSRRFPKEAVLESQRGILSGERIPEY